MFKRNHKYLTEQIITLLITQSSYNLVAFHEIEFTR